MIEHSSVTPSRDDFTNTYNAGNAQIVFTRIISDLETPVSAYLKLAGGNPWSFLLESVEGGETLGRYSIIGMRPDLIWMATNDGIKVIHNPDTDSQQTEIDPRPILESFDDWNQKSRLPLPDNVMPMAAGLFGYFSYDVVRACEHLPNRPPIDQDCAVPEAIFMRPTLVAVFDNVQQSLTLATPVRVHSRHQADEAYEAALARLEQAISQLQKPLPPGHSDTLATENPLTPNSNTTPEQYTMMVERAKDHIRAGDIFQVVLSQRFSCEFHKPPFSLYRALRRENPSPFLFFLNFERHALVGSSPEILVRVRQGEVTVRPIAGTRPRGKTLKEDVEFEQDLLADPKERAEHLMLLDLGRNDVGRSATMGSVHVTDEFIIERYSHVMHIVSNVTGQLRSDLSPLTAVMNGFPAGTVSGAPKVRAMEIIDELEPSARGAYAGAIGYFSANGDVDTAITLRTALIKDGNLFAQAGAGIVADSQPQAEYQECVNKAKAVFSAASKA